MASPNVGGYYVWFDQADASGATARITCIAGGAVIAESIQLEIGGDAVVIDVPEDGKRISLRYISFREWPDVQNQVAAEVIVTNL
jgi:hypothetical protein